MENRQIDNKTTKQIRIDAGLHRLLKLHATKTGKTIKQLVEECLTELFDFTKDIHEYL